MAKLIVQAIDHPMPIHPKRGHVLQVCEDFEDEGSNVRDGILQKDGSRIFLFRIVRVPGPAADYEHLIASDQNGKDAADAREFRYRKVKVDLDAIEIADAAKGKDIADKTVIVAAEKAALEAAVAVEAVPDDPFVIPPKERG